MFKRFKLIIHEWKLDKQIGRELENAVERLPRDINLQWTCASLETFRDFFAHGEYELALEQLEEIGDDLSSQGIPLSPDFWDALSTASTLMGNGKTTDRLRTKIMGGDDYEYR